MSVSELYVFLSQANPMSSKAADLTRLTLEILPPPFAWVAIPAGRVTLDIAGEGKETVDVPAYLIAKYPLTNAQFARFMDAGGYHQRQWWTNEGWRVRQEDNWTQPKHWTEERWNGADYPVVGVSWFEALAFTRWLNATLDTPGHITLPTEMQWQRAAGDGVGDDTRAYPWGDYFDATRCNTIKAQLLGKNVNGTTPVTRYEGIGDSPFGVVDMCGNVFEWTLTDYASRSNDVTLRDVRRVMRGGSWFHIPEDCRITFRYDWYPSLRHSCVGLRLACVDVH
jgi:formylglycine-generating enzyme required for sulfatase activity